ncbi:MAG: hypothetical protein HEQ13_20110 [Dolichospermum sp. DEX189]|jgi:hypothetical protein|nr:hypothetical protein [Dolichospermum sp. DEX189]
MEYCFATPIVAVIGFEELIESFRQWFEVVSWNKATLRLFVRIDGWLRDDLMLLLGKRSQVASVLHN